jgi:hypothetical protein
MRAAAVVVVPIPRQDATQICLPAFALIVVAPQNLLRANGDAKGHHGDRRALVWLWIPQQFGLRGSITWIPNPVE